MTDIIGYLAGILTVSSFMPQVYKSWSTRRTGDLSKITGILMILTSWIWVIYGFLMGSMPMIITNFVVFCLVLSIILISFLPKF